MEQMGDMGALGLSEEQAELLSVAMSFCRDRSPVEKVRALMNDELGFDGDVWAEIGALGWLGVAIPESYGGAGLGLAEAAPIAEAMGRYLLNTPYVSTTLAAQAILAAGTEAQKQDWLPRIATGEAATVALFETEGEWDALSFAATAKADGDGFSLAGVKRFVTDAAAAQLIIVGVSFEGRPALIVLQPDDLASATMRRETIVDETLRSCELTLDGVVVPAGRMLDVGATPGALKRLHLAANLLAAADMAGGNLSVIDYTLDYLRTRKQFGKPIGSYQALKHPMVDAYVMYEQARSHVYSAAHSFEDQGAGEVAVRMAKVAALEAYGFASDRAIQFHGGFGFTWDCDAQLHRRRAIWRASQYGDAVHHKRALAELVLG